jgi:prepilin-type N-terminal cleavage/methylation domain-containing protein/prepilin-type processing-associated H-X9-DG protein
MSARGRGFTLMEVCVSVSIIAILAAILFPVFARAREKARQERCLSNLQQIYLALSMYARDHAGRFPPANDDLTPLLGRYLLMEEVLTCPSYERRGPLPPGEAPFSYFYRAGFCDDDDPGTLLVCDSSLTLHNEGANALLADGHARWYGRSSGSSGTKPNPLTVIAPERPDYVVQPPRGGGMP